MEYLHWVHLLLHNILSCIWGLALEKGLVIEMTYYSPGVRSWSTARSPRYKSVDCMTLKTDASYWNLCPLKQNVLPALGHLAPILADIQSAGSWFEWLQRTRSFLGWDQCFPKGLFPVPATICRWKYDLFRKSGK